MIFAVTWALSLKQLTADDIFQDVGSKLSLERLAANQTRLPKAEELAPSLYCGLYVRVPVRTVDN